MLSARQRDEAMLRAEYVSALRELADATQVYDELPLARPGQPQSVLRHDLAAKRVWSAEQRLYAIIHDARALGLQLQPETDVPAMRSWDWVYGLTGVAIVTLSMLIIMDDHGPTQWLALAILALVAVAALAASGVGADE